MDAISTLTHATERDVDLLLVEELKCSAEFVRWLCAKLESHSGEIIRVDDSEVTHSRRRTYNRREIDICLELKSHSGLPTFVLIENKLDTSEQYEQAESYRAEAKLLVKQGEALRAFTVLVCPDSYSRLHASFAGKFDTVITYEEVSLHFAGRARGQSELGRRLRHRHQVIEQAITKSRRGYQAVPLAVIEQFNAKYIALAARTCPRLKPGPSMLKEGRPGESKTMIFGPGTLPDWDFLPRTRLVHQLREGNANVCFYGWGEHFIRLAGVIAADLSKTSYRLVPSVNKRANGQAGLMIVAETPRVDNLKGFDAQMSAIEAGLKVTDELRAWIWSHRKQIRLWAASIPQEGGGGD